MAAFEAASSFRYNFRSDVPQQFKDRHGLTRTLQAARMSTALLACALAASCAKTPVAPTVPPVAPPVISCPASQSLTSPLATPMSVVYSPPSVAGGASPITTSCTPVSGSTFPVGSTTITCTATDAQQRASSCSLTVSVTVPARLRLTKFVAFGDSITWGEDGQNALTADNGGVLTFVRSIVLNGFQYPTVLQNSLMGRYALQIDSLAVRNQGCPGESASDSLSPACGIQAVQRFTTAIQGQQAVLIMEGSNDLYFAYREGNSVTEAALVNLQKMIRAAKSAGVVPYLATVPPMNPNACTPLCRGFAANLVAAFDDRIRLLATSEGITLVDVHKAFNGDFTLLSQDGLHPNAFGYARIADTFFQSIRGSLELTTLSGAPTQSPIPLSGF